MGRSHGAAKEYILGARLLQRVYDEAIPDTYRCTSWKSGNESDDNGKSLYGAVWGEVLMEYGVTQVDNIDILRLSTKCPDCQNNRFIVMTEIVGNVNDTLGKGSILKVPLLRCTKCKAIGEPAWGYTEGTDTVTHIPAGFYKGYELEVYNAVENEHRLVVSSRIWGLKARITDGIREAVIEGTNRL